MGDQSVLLAAADGDVELPEVERKREQHVLIVAGDKRKFVYLSVPVGLPRHSKPPLRHFACENRAMSDDVYEEKARAARLLLYAEPSPGRELLQVACKEARDAAPDDVARRQWDRVIDALSQGHRFKTSVVPAVFAVGDEVGMIAAVEQVFEGIET